MGDKIFSLGNLLSMALVASLASAIGFVAGWIMCQHTMMDEQDLNTPDTKIQERTSGIVEKRVVHENNEVTLGPISKQLDQILYTAKPTTVEPKSYCPNSKLSSNGACPMLCPGPIRYYTMFSGMSWFVADDNPNSSGFISYSIQSRIYNSDIKCRELCRRDLHCYTVIFDPTRKRCWAYFTWQEMDYDGRMWCSRMFSPGNGTMMHSDFAKRHDKMCSCRTKEFNNEDYFLISLSRHALCIDNATVNPIKTITDYERIQC